MRFKKVNTTPDIDNMSDAQLTAYLNRKFVVRLETKEFVTGSMFTSSDKNKAQVFESYSEALDEKIRLQKTESKKSEVLELY